MFEVIKVTNVGRCIFYSNWDQLGSVDNSDLGAKTDIDQQDSKKRRLTKPSPNLLPENGRHPLAHQKVNKMVRRHGHN